MAEALHNPKQRVKQIVDDLPDDSSFDELLRELALHRMIERGLADLEAGRVISHEDMKKRVESWLS